MITLLTETKDPVKAQAAIDQMNALSEEWALKLHQAEQSIKAIEANAGDDVLASILDGGDGSGDIVTKLVNAKAQYDIAVKTLAAIERHQIIAKANLRLARAHQLRLQAAEKGRERDKHLVKVIDLLGKLKELEGAPYTPWKPQPRTPGVYSDPPAPYAIPVSEVLEGQVKELLFQAEQLENSAGETLAKVNGKPAPTRPANYVLQPA